MDSEELACLDKLFGNSLLKHTIDEIRCSIVLQLNAGLQCLKAFDSKIPIITLAASVGFNRGNIDIIAVGEGYHGFIEGENLSHILESGDTATCKH